MRRKPEAICTAALIAVNAAVFLVLSLFGDTEDPAFMLRHGAMYEEYVIRGREYYRLFTCLFLHFGIEHLLNNMVLLGALGWNLEAVTGKARFLAIYFGAAWRETCCLFSLTGRPGKMSYPQARQARSSA